MAGLQHDVDAHRSALDVLITSLRSYRVFPKVFEKIFEDFLREIESQIEQLLQTIREFQPVRSDSIIEGQKEFARLRRYISGLHHDVDAHRKALDVLISSLRSHRMCPERCAGDLWEIKSQIEELFQTIRDFQPGLAPSSPTGPVAVTVASLFEEARELFSDLTKAQSIQLKFEPARDIQFFGQRQLLMRVLTILIDNAADAIGRDGTIALRARRGKARLKETRTEAVILEVEDTGSGIPAEVQGRLFHPFFSTKSHGIGLGLATAAWFVAENGGAIEFKTKLGHGTAFTVILPAAETL